MIEGIALGIAVCSAVLAGFNTWKIYDRDRVKIKIVPIQITLVESGRMENGWRLGVKVINIGLLPTTITGVGFEMVGGGKMVFMEPFILGGGSLPRVLTPQSAFVVCTNQNPHQNALWFKDAYCAFAETDCDETFKGTSKVLEKIISDCKERS